MLFAALIFTILSTNLKDEIIKMDFNKFKNNVANRGEYETWLVLISNQNGNENEIKVFNDAFKIGKGFLKFGYIENEKNSNIQKKLHLKKIPQFCIYHMNGQKCIDTDIQAKNLINLASSYLPDFTAKASTKWIEKDEANPVAILFTEKEDTPMLWAAISLKYHKKQIRIGISRDKNFAKSLGVEKFPTILLHNFSHNIIYDGPNNFESLSSEIEKFIQKKVQKVSKEMTILPLKQYDNVCTKSGKVCIIHCIDSLDPKFHSIRKENPTPIIDFLYGSGPYPVNKMKDGGLYAVFSEKNKYFEISNIDNLEEVIHDIMYGELLWESYEPNQEL